MRFHGETASVRGFEVKKTPRPHVGGTSLVNGAPLAHLSSSGDGRRRQAMKRPTYLILILATILVGLFAGATLAVTASGTDQDDRIYGTNAADIIGARGGDDVVRGLRGSDSLYGNTGEDRIFGGLGEDELHGGYGNDTLYSADDRSSRGYRDVVYCGHGRDFASIDRWDRVTSDCEEVR